MIWISDVDIIKQTFLPTRHKPYYIDGEWHASKSKIRLRKSFLKRTHIKLVLVFFVVWTREDGSFLYKEEDVIGWDSRCATVHCSLSMEYDRIDFQG